MYIKAYRGLPVAPLAVKNGNLGFPHTQAQMFSHSVIHFYTPRTSCCQKCCSIKADLSPKSM